jgi:mono/diheme cytochrome c family protein
MTLGRNVAALLACAPLLLGAPAKAQEPAQQQSGQQQAAPHPGRSVVMSKCFQCHTDSMFRDQRQDRRGWEAAIYRMIGRGGLWTVEEIKLMADYLGTDFGPNSKPAGQSR